MITMTTLDALRPETRDWLVAHGMTVAQQAREGDPLSREIVNAYDAAMLSDGDTRAVAWLEHLIWCVSAE